ncbi:unnamed protein product [Psylliodes chrysocephalus]|uniref:Uncharacterized protein n=1 Tax=Psylliodes chrysocephalus TaxID=3402493 RepID=A0A9P0CE64_9CUCU|nr:unnamed protein product [Psylliodes chrysocephala]
MKLKPWGQAFWKLMDGNRNPTLCKVLGGVQVGVPPPIQTAASVDISLDSESCVSVPETAKSTASQKMEKPRLPETAETQNLLTTELQRLVLLKQLEVLRLKKRKLMRELEQEELLVTENDKVYTQL